MLQSEGPRKYRRGWPIHGFCGPNGGGKTACMVWDTLPSLDAGRTVLSTVRLLDWRNPRPCEGCSEDGHQAGHMQAHPSYVAFREWDQLMEAEHCDVLMDEVTGVASSRESAGLPAPVANKLVQLRRADVVVRYSAPNFSRADKIIRECTQAVTYCSGYFPKTAPPVEGEEDRLWSQRRLFRWKTYDAAAFEDFTAGKRDALDSEVRQWFWGPGSEVFAAYDTLDAVLSIGSVSDAGRCYRCGGKRDVPRCRCSKESAGPTTTEDDGAAGRKAGGRPVAPPTLAVVDAHACEHDDTA